ncbi:MAG TPA: c-type cytochrome [Chitinophagaceae bacterium]|nr:c-type cytochrome [Chitinophagaceae bacterium]
MLRFLKRTGIILLILFAGLYITMILRQNRKFDAPYPAIKATTDTAVIARGKSLVYGPAHCADCHTPPQFKEEVAKGLVIPLSGGNVFDLPIGKIYTKNITPAATGIGKMTDGEIARALRYGVAPDGHALFDIMPFHNTSDEDLTAIISYLRQLEPVENNVPENSLNFLGKAVNAFLLKPVGPSETVLVTVKRDTSAAYGKYLAASVANCRGCHTNRNLMTGAFIGQDYSGGFTLEEDTDSGKYVFTTPNLTPDDSTGRLKGWTKQQFINRFRAGRIIPHSPMPWGPFSRMSDDELKAIYAFLQTVKPVHNEIKQTLRIEK